MNGFLKIPMQFFILLIGVLVFIFFQYEKTPINFNPYVIEKVKETDKREDFNAIVTANEIIHLEKQKHLTQKDFFTNHQLQSQYLQLEKKAEKNRKEAKKLIEKIEPKVDASTKTISLFISF